jgi:hypothetical protein
MLYFAKQPLDFSLFLVQRRQLQFAADSQPGPDGYLPPSQKIKRFFDLVILIIHKFYLVLICGPPLLGGFFLRPSRRIVLLLATGRCSNV